MHTGQKINVVFGICLIPILLLSPLAYKAGAIDLMASLGKWCCSRWGALNLVAMLGLVAFAIKKIPFVKQHWLSPRFVRLFPSLRRAAHIKGASGSAYS